jgi:stress response protein SCP2
VHSGDMINGDGGQHTLRIDLHRLPESVECLFLTMSSFAGAKLGHVEQPYIW